MFSTNPKTNFNFSVTFILSSADAFNLDQSKILLFGKELMVQIKWTLTLIAVRIVLYNPSHGLSMSATKKKSRVEEKRGFDTIPHMDYPNL